MKIKVITSEQVTPGEMVVVDGAHNASIGFNPAPFIDVDAEPVRVLFCHPSDGPRVQEAIEEAGG